MHPYLRPLPTIQIHIPLQNLQLLHDPQLPQLPRPGLTIVLIILIIHVRQIDHQPRAAHAHVVARVREQRDDEFEELSLGNQLLAVARFAGGDVHEDVGYGGDDFGLD